MTRHRTFYEALGIPRPDTPPQYEPRDPACRRCGTMRMGKGFWWCPGEGWACHECQTADDWTVDDVDAMVARGLDEAKRKKEESSEGLRADEKRV